MTEDQRPARQDIERDGGQHDQQTPDRALQRGDEGAQRGKAQKRQQRPLQAAHQPARAMGKIRVLPHGEQDRLALPQYRPGGDDEQRGGAQRLMNGAAHVAHRMAAAAPFAGDQWRCGSDQPHAEQQQRMKQVDGERARRDSLRPQAAQQQQIRRGNRRPGDIARDHRQREGDKRGGFDTPGGGHGGL